jgi:orotate phosphoribosyltransferase
VQPHQYTLVGTLNKRAVKSGGFLLSGAAADLRPFKPHSRSQSAGLSSGENLLSFVQGRQGHFQLESLHHGGLWFDLETLCLHSRGIQPFGAQFAAKFAPHKADVICGPLVEGACIALLVSIELGCDFVYAERFASPSREGLFPVEYRIPKALRAAVQGKRVAIVNDVTSARSAVRGAFSDLQSIGVDVVAIGALLGLGNSIAKFAAEHRVSLELLQQMPHNLWTPAQCPLSAAGTPQETMGAS